VVAPADDLDGQGRPSSGGYEAGADELAGAVPPPNPGPTPPPAPGLAFPSTGLLDTFNRANSNALGASWSASTGFRVNANALNARAGGLATWTAATFGANQEAWFTFTELSPFASEQGLVLKANPAGTAMIKVVYRSLLGQVRISTLDPTNGWQVRATFTGVVLAAGDHLGARAASDGTVTAYKNGTALGATNVASGTSPWPTPQVRGGGRVGVQFTGTQNNDLTDARVDDFGGGTVP